MPRLRPEEWHAEVLRVTAFTPPNTALVVGMDWWTTVAGSAPESRISKPREALFQEAGPFENGVLTLKIGQGSRIDWALGPLPTLAIEPDFIGEFPSALNAFVAAVRRWLTLQRPPIVRLAFGAVLVHREASVDDGMRQLSDYLDSIDIDPSSRDFLFQINRLRQSRVLPATMLNRLTKWAVVTIQSVRITAPGEVDLADGSFATRLEIDFSTPARSANPLPDDKLGQVLDEFVALANEVVERGDVP